MLDPELVADGPLRFEKRITDSIIGAFRYGVHFIKNPDKCGLLGKVSVEEVEYILVRHREAYSEPR